MTPPPSQVASEPDLADQRYQASLQSDAELLDLYVLGGQTQALLTLLSRFTPMMTSVIRRVVSHAQDAEDAFQATCLVLMQSAKKIRSRRSIAAWLYGVAYRTACRVRGKSRRQATGLDPMELPDKNLPDDPIEQLVRQIELSNLDRELQSLPDAYREPLIEHYILGFTAREIAERMELSSSAVEGRLRRGRQMLRERLAERGASLSVCVAGVAWMRDHQQTAAVGQQLTDHFVQSSTFQCPENLSTQDSYLFELVKGETHMHTASLFKSFGFLGTVAFATFSLSMLAYAMQLGGGAPTKGGASAGGVQAVQAQDEPAAAPRVVEAAKPASADQSKNATKKNSAEVIRFVQPSTPAPGWLKAGQEDQIATEEVRDHLRSNYEFDFHSVPLSAAVKTISEKVGMEFIIDEQSLDNSGATADGPVTLKTDLPLHQGLGLMLKQLNLNYEVHPRFVKIVSDDDVQMAIRYYDLSRVVPTSAGVRSVVQSAMFVMDEGHGETISIVGSMMIATAKESGHRQIERLLSEIAKVPPENLPSTYSQAEGEGVVFPAGMGGGGLGRGGMGGGMGGGGMF